MTKPLRQADAVFLRMDAARTPMHVGCLLTFRLPDDAPPDFLKQLLASLRGVRLNPPYSYRLANPRLAKLAPAWEEATEMDMDYHVRHTALPWPGGERELGVLISRLLSHPLDLTRPLWETYLIEGLQGRRFAVFMKVHHACADGAAGIRAMKTWLTEDPKDRDLSRSWTGTPPPKPERAATNGGKSRMEAIGDQLRAARELVGKLREMNRRDTHPEGGMYSARETPRTPFNVSVTAQRRVATQAYEFARFKALSEATGASINDIVLTIAGGAMRRYLKEYNALPDKSLIASVPVALPRKEAGRHNAVAGFVLPLATDNPDPLKRLALIQTVTRRTKKDLMSLSSAALDQFAAIGFLPMVIGQMTGLNAHMRPLTNITISNVPGPQKPLYLAGAELEAIYPVAPLFDGYAISLTLVSYADRYCLGFVGCRNALPHLQRLAVYTGLALEDLEVAVAAKG